MLVHIHQPNNYGVHLIISESHGSNLFSYNKYTKKIVRIVVFSSVRLRCIFSLWMIFYLAASGQIGKRSSTTKYMYGFWSFVHFCKHILPSISELERENSSEPDDDDECCSCSAMLEMCVAVPSFISAAARCDHHQRVNLCAEV